MVQKGDIVRFLNSTGGGRVARVTDNMAYVEDEDGFEVPVLIRECVVVRTAAEAAAQEAALRGAPKGYHSAAPGKKVNDAGAKTGRPDSAESRNAAGSGVTPSPAAAQREGQTVYGGDEELDLTETPDGDVLNIVLGFEATDIKHLSLSEYQCSLVNDSNYYLYFSILTRAAGDNRWTPRYDGLVEPNIQVTVGRYTLSELSEFDRLSFQCVAFKRDKEFDRQSPVSAEFKVDTTKFCKFHCFRSSCYFDAPAITFDIVRDGKVIREDEVMKLVAEMSVGKEEKATAVVGGTDAGQRMSPSVKRAFRDKVRADRHRAVPSPRAFSKSSAPGEPIEVDLHIDSLLDSTAGMSAADILNHQIDTFRAVMDAHLKDHGRKIIFIHGKGEGVLRQALTKELNHRYKGHDVQDASFSQYGYGATQVTIR